MTGTPIAVFALQAVVVLTTARVLGLVARRLGQPVVVAEMMAGLLLGPSVLGWIAPGAWAALFPAASLRVLGHVSDVGLLLFMFLVGLEVDVRLLKGRARTAAVASPAAVLLPFALGCGVAWWARPQVAADAPLLPFMLFVGAAMSMAAFPVLARILVELRLLRSSLGAVAIACAAAVDVIAWCVVAFVLVAVRTRSVGEAVQTTALATLFVAFMVGVARPLLARASRRARHASEGVVGGALVLLLLASWATEVVGVGALFGAFLFGAIVPKAGGIARHLAEKLEDVVLLLLVPLFFAYTGLRTQIGLLDGAGAWELCAVIVVVGCVGKVSAGTLAARITGFGWREAGALGVLLNTRGLMALVVLNLGLDLGILPPSLFTMLIVMALVTTVMATPLLELIYPRRRRVADAAAATDAAVAARAPAAGSVLACVDVGASDEEVASTLALARALARAGRTYLVQLVAAEDRASFMLDQQADEGDAAADALAVHVERARAAGHDVRALSFVTSRPALDLCELAAVKGAEVILIASRDGYVGAAASEVIARAPATVAVLVPSRRADAALADAARVGPREVVAVAGTSPDDAAARELAERIALSSEAALRVADARSFGDGASMVVAACEHAPRAGAADGPAVLLVRAGARAGGARSAAPVDRLR